MGWTFGCAAMTTTLPEFARMPFTPRDYGRMAAQYLLDNPRCMLVADPGLGKTSITLNALDLLKFGSAPAFPALVLAPKRVADVVWTSELAKWDAFEDLSVIQVLGTKVTHKNPKTKEVTWVDDPRLDALRKPVAEIYVMNYDNIPWLVDQFARGKWPFRTVIADESSRLKGFRKSKGGARAHALSMVAQFTSRWWNLTGTPIPNGLQDLWGQMYFVDFGERLKRSYTAYKEAFFIENQYNRSISMQFGAEAEIHKLVADRMLALRAEDWLDIQKPQELPMEVCLEPRLMDQYRELEKNFFLDLGPQAKVKAGTAAVKSYKLLQFCSGSVFVEGSVPHHVHDAKLEALEEILEKIAPKPLLVAYWWTADVPRILAWCAKHLIAARVYAGKKDEDDWNAGKIRVLLLQYQSAYGLNLAKPCHDLCEYSYVWNAELKQQMLERIGPARQEQLGLKRVVRVWSIRTKGTIEHDVADSNDKKITVEQALKRARARRNL